METREKFRSIGRHASPALPGGAAGQEPPAPVIAALAQLISARQLDRLEEQALAAIQRWPNIMWGGRPLGILRLMQGRAAAALEPLTNNVKLTPDDAQAHHNLGSALMELGRFAEAAEAYRHSLLLNPAYPQAHGNLGIAQMSLGKLAEAEASYRQALALQPDYAQAHSGLGDVLLKLGRVAAAIASYRKAVEFAPRLVQAHDGLSHALSRLTPLWHVPMMNDRLRNDAYFAALRAAVRPEMHGLEIGTGSGVLAMMAAKLGARRVTTCEAVPEIAETARAIVADNGFAPRSPWSPKCRPSWRSGLICPSRPICWSPRSCPVSFSAKASSPALRMSRAAC